MASCTKVTENWKPPKVSAFTVDSTEVLPAQGDQYDTALLHTFQKNETKCNDYIISLQHFTALCHAYLGPIVASGIRKHITLSAETACGHSLRLSMWWGLLKEEKKHTTKYRKYSVRCSIAEERAQANFLVNSASGQEQWITQIRQTCGRRKTAHWEAQNNRKPLAVLTKPLITWLIATTNSNASDIGDRNISSFSSVTSSDKNHNWLNATTIGIGRYSGSLHIKIYIFIFHNQQAANLSRSTWSAD